MCKKRATEVCIKLKDELTAEIQRLNYEVEKRDETIKSMEGQQSRYEENLSKGLNVYLFNKLSTILLS